MAWEIAPPPPPRAASQQLSRPVDSAALILLGLALVSVVAWSRDGPSPASPYPHEQPEEATRRDGKGCLTPERTASRPDAPFHVQQNSHAGGDAVAHLGRPRLTCCRL